MIRHILLALVAAVTPLAAARSETLLPGRIEPFEVRSSDRPALAWLERWLKDNQPDDNAAYDQAMAFALSAAERRHTRDNSAPDNSSISVSQGYLLSRSHLGKIHYMAEIRWSAELTNAQVPGIDDPAQPRWQTRHLCAGVLVAADWVLTAAKCVSPAKLEAGIEVALGTSDLARDNGFARTVRRMIHHPAAGLALLELDGTTEGYAERGIAPAQLDPDAGTAAPDEPDASKPRANYSVLGWGTQINSTGQAIAPWRYSVVSEYSASDCGLAVSPGGSACLTNNAFKFCREDSGGPVYRNVSEKGAWLVGIVSWDQPDCFKQLASDEQPYTAAPIIQLAPYRDWLLQTITPQ